MWTAGGASLRAKERVESSVWARELTTSEPFPLPFFFFLLGEGERGGGSEPVAILSSFRDEALLLKERATIWDRLCGSLW